MNKYEPHSISLTEPHLSEDIFLFHLTRKDFRDHSNFLSIRAVKDTTHTTQFAVIVNGNEPVVIGRLPMKTNPHPEPNIVDHYITRIDHQRKPVEQRQFSITE